jgi:thiosulfate reductase cytochrome b subunit
MTHWLTALAFFALLLSGAEIVVSHPRFYWGESGNSLTPPLFQIPIPASRASVPTGYGYVLPDQNGWSRSLHFQAAWLLFFTAAVYLGAGLRNGYLRRLFPSAAERSLPHLLQSLRAHLRLHAPPGNPYNVLQKLAYLTVVFFWFPLMFWTGLAMSPAFAAAFPFTVNLLGGHQSARTVHFFSAVALVLFAAVHVLMVWRAGFLPRTRAMITGQPVVQEERS